MLNIKKIGFIVRDWMRYDDAGDYRGNYIYAYDTKNEIYNNAILIHEFIEYILLDAQGITWEAMDKISMHPEMRKKLPGVVKEYTKAHKLATKIEKEYIKRLGENWEEYDRFIESMKVVVAK